MKFLINCSVCDIEFEAHARKTDGRYHCGRICAKRGRAEKLKRQAEQPEAEETGTMRLDFAILRHVGTLTVVNDPLDKGGWKTGHTFSRDEWLRMYHQMTFTHGTILQDGRGRLYRADGSVA